jgi:hypothetical protein
VTPILIGILVIVIVAAYFSPTIISALRNHPQGGPIAIVNLFLGWTLVGWVVALAWSVSAMKREKKRPLDHQRRQTQQFGEVLARCIKVANHLDDHARLR